MMTSLAMFGSAVVSVIMHDPQSAQWGITRAAIETLLIGIVLWFATKGKVDLTRKDGFGIVVLGWVMVCHVGCLPYVHTGEIPHPVDAFFETISGFTTTGASILDTVDGISYGILFWRSLTQWLGGMGVLLLCVAILPFLGVGGMQIYRAEVPGPSKDRLTPRIASTAKLLWFVYVILTTAQTLLLKLAGMGWFDAICHAFCTLSTGGFSTHTASAAAFDSNAIQIILIVFMILGGINFSIHYRALHGDVKQYISNAECRLYLLLILLFGIAISASVFGSNFDRIDEALIAGFFQVTSIVTTTGFANTDYDQWSNFSRYTLFALMFVGGCAGSTTGGIKTIRIQVMVKEVLRQVRLFMMPQAVLKVRIGKKPVDYNIVASIAALVVSFIAIFALGTVAMTFFTPDITSAASASIAALGNIGPGLGSVGPAQNFAEIPYAGKIILSLLMLMGRLELFSVMVVLHPNFWKK